MKKEEKKLNKILFFRFAFIGVALLIIAAFWSVLNWERRPAFIQSEMAIFKENFDGKGLGFTFGQGSMKGRGDARILGWGYGNGWSPGSSETTVRTQFAWLCWTLPNGRIYFEFSSDIKLTEQDIQSLAEARHIIGERLNGVRIVIPGYWRDYCAKEVEPGGITARLACDEKGMLNGVLVRLKEQIPSISGIKVAEYLFSK